MSNVGAITSTGESNTIVSAYTLYRHLQYYCTRQPTCRVGVGEYSSHLVIAVVSIVYKYAFFRGWGFP